MEITRKEFLKTAAGVAATAYLAGNREAAAAPPSNIKLGVTLYSYAFDLRAGAMTLEEAIADAADLGAEGIEILGESHVPDYPKPSEAWVRQWFRWMDQYRVKPSAYDDFVDTMFYKGRLLRPDEAVERLVVDFQLAHRLGFKVLRQQWAPYPPDNPADAHLAPYAASKPAMQVIEKALPFAEKYDVFMAVELHSPTSLQSPWMDTCLEFIARTKTKHFGFCPDMSIFVTRPPHSREADLIEQGARRNVLDYIAHAYENNLGPDKTVAEVERMGGNEVEKRWAGVAGVYHFSNNDPQDLARVVPYSRHVHAKFYEMQDDLTEYSIPYAKVIPVLVENGYQGYLSSEYEGAREDLQTSAQIRLQHAMLRRLLGEGQRVSG